MKKTYYKTQEDWETIRNGLISDGRIGGSMVGTVCGTDPFKSPYRLWAEMTGRLEREDISHKEAIINGHDLEDYVAERFCRLTGKKVHRENCIMTCDDAPHLFASIDRKVSGEESGLECKTASAYRDSAFAKGNFPDGYFRQVKTYLKVTGLERWYLAAFIMGIDFRVFIITTKEEDLANPPEWCSGIRYVSQAELDACEAEAAAFIEDCVKADVPPPMVGAEDERPSITAVNGTSDAKAELSADIDNLIDTRAELKKACDVAKAEITRLENEIIQALAGCKEGRTANNKVYYKVSETRRLNTDAIKAALGGEIPDSYYKVSSGATLRISSTKK